MKKLTNIPVLSILLFSIIIYSCSNDDKNLSLDKSKNKIIFEDVTLKTNISPNFYDNHFFLIEKLGDNVEKDEIISISSEKGMNIDEKEIKKLYLNNSEIIMYSAPFKDSDKSLIIYRYNEIYQLSIANYFKTNNGVMQFELNTLDNKSFYSIKVNHNNNMGDFILNKNSQMNEFSKHVYSLHQQKHNKQNNDFLTKEDCCRHASSWGGCMDCTVSACGSSWACAGAFGIAPKEMLAAFAVSCIGSGSGTFC